MTRVIPPKLTHWIERHKGIVQPYALDALVDLWFSESQPLTQPGSDALAGQRLELADVKEGS